MEERENRRKKLSLSNTYFVEVGFTINRMLGLRVLFTFSIFHLTSGQYFLNRKENGDQLEGPDQLDCTLHNAKRFSSNQCNCGPRSTYYTDKNNVTQCFKGPGAAELDCDVYVKDNTPKDIITRSLNAGFETMYLDHMLYHCNLEFQSIMYWANETWVELPKEYENFLPASKTYPPDRYGYSKQWKGISWLPFNDNMKDYYAGKLIRFNWKICEQMSCILFKFTGRKPWSPHIISTPVPTTTTTTTTTPTTTTPTTTTPTTTTPKIVTAPKTGDDNDDDELLIKVLVPVGIFVFLVIVGTAIYFYWRHKNSRYNPNTRVPKDNTVFVSGSVVPQPTIKKGHVDLGDNNIFIDISDQSPQHMNVQNPKNSF